MHLRARQTTGVPVLDIRRHAQRVTLADDQSALSDAGRAMCERLAKEAPRYAFVVASPLPRAKETAERIAGRLDAVDPGLLPDLGSHAAQLFGHMRTLDDWARLLDTNEEARRYAEAQLPTWQRFVTRVGERDHVLAISHGGLIDLPAIVLMRRFGVPLAGPVFGYGEGVRVTYAKAAPTRIELLRAAP